MVWNRFRYRWGLWFCILALSTACTSAVRKAPSTQPVVAAQNRSQTYLENARAAYQEGLQALDEDDPERARRAFDKAG